MREISNTVCEGSLEECEYNSVRILYGHGNTDVRNTSLPVAVWITAHARIRMHQLSHALSLAGYPRIYGDTDSVFTSVELETVLPELAEQVIPQHL